MDIRQCTKYGVALKGDWWTLDIFPNGDMRSFHHGNTMCTKLCLDPYPFARLQGQGEKFAVHIARQLLERMSRYHLWGEE